MKKIIFILSILFLPLSAVAYEETSQFQINDVFVSTTDDLYFRVISADDSTWHCNGGPQYPGWSYVDYSDPAAKAKIAALTTAFVTQKNIKVMTEQTVVDGVTYCKIMQVQVY